MNKFLFVYNADSGYFNGLADMAHKIFSPSTYPCSLCDLTYGIFKIKPAWEEFVQQAPLPFEFLHKDEFVLAYPEWSGVALPTILRLNENNPVEIVVSAAQLNEMTSLDALQQAILEKI